MICHPSRTLIYLSHGGLILSKHTFCLLDVPFFILLFSFFFFNLSMDKVLNGIVDEVALEGDQGTQDNIHWKQSADAMIVYEQDAQSISSLFLLKRCLPRP